MVISSVTVFFWRRQGRTWQSCSRALPLWISAGSSGQLCAGPFSQALCSVGDLLCVLLCNMRPGWQPEFCTGILNMEHWAAHKEQLPRGLEEKADHQCDLEIQTYGHRFKNNFFSSVPLTAFVAALWWPRPCDRVGSVSVLGTTFRVCFVGSTILWKQADFLASKAQHILLFLYLDWTASSCASLWCFFS